MAIRDRTAFPHEPFGVGRGQGHVAIGLADIPQRAGKQHVLGHRDDEVPVPRRVGRPGGHIPNQGSAQGGEALVQCSPEGAIADHLVDRRCWRLAVEHVLPRVRYDGDIIDWIRPELTTQPVRLANQHSAKVSPQILDLCWVLHLGDGIERLLQGVFREIGAPRPASGEVPDLGILLYPEQPPQEFRLSVEGCGAHQGAPSSTAGPNRLNGDDDTLPYPTWVESCKLWKRTLFMLIVLHRWP